MTEARLDPIVLVPVHRFDAVLFDMDVHAPPARCVVVEDAVAGVHAGRSGHFGLGIGVDRIGQTAALRAEGADKVVTDLAHVRVVD